MIILLIVVGIYYFTLSNGATIRILTNSTNNIYAEGSNEHEIIGYDFSLRQNVLIVKVNGTQNGVSDPNQASFVVAPNLLFEFNSTISLNQTQSAYRFLDGTTNNDNGNWGNGLSAEKFRGINVFGTNNVEVWMISANWTNPKNSKGPKLQAKMYIASSQTIFQRIRAGPNAVTMRFSILDYPFQLKNSTLAFSQLVLSEGSQKDNPVNNTDFDYLDTDLGFLLINRTAVIDGKPQLIGVSKLNNTNITSIVGNSRNPDFTSYEKSGLILSFNNSAGAKNVTFAQRLGINLTQLRLSGTQNAATLLKSSPFWTSLSLGLSSFLFILPVILF